MMDLLMLAQAEAEGGGKSMMEMLVTGGGVIGYILWAISVVTVSLIVMYFMKIRRSSILPEMIRQQAQQLFEEKEYREVINLTEQQPDFLSYIIHASLSDAPHGYGAMERAMEEAAEERTTKLLRSIEWLNLIGNIGPMLGLLGTVWGMILAFIAISKSQGNVDPGEMANNIGVALVTTLLGLSVSIPALSVFAILRNRIDALTSEAIMSGQELISAFRPSKR